MNLGRIMVLTPVLAATGGGGLPAFLEMSAATLCLLLLLSVPWLALRYIEYKSGDPLWLYHKVFRD